MATRNSWANCLTLGILALPAVCQAKAQGAPANQIQISPQAQCQRDLAICESEVAKQRAHLASMDYSEASKDDVKQMLKARCELDQYVRKSLSIPFDHGYGGTAAAGEFKEALLRRMNDIDEENSRVLRSLLDRWEWFDRREWGTEADANAWLLAQHADHDLPLQKRVLAFLEPLLESKGTDASNYALLFDRVAVNEGRFQRFGTQGYCVGPGKWIPRPMEDPDGVDARRKAMGLSTLAEYIVRFKNICRQDETQRALKVHGLPLQKP